MRCHWSLLCLPLLAGSVFAQDLGPTRIVDGPPPALADAPERPPRLADMWLPPSGEDLSGTWQVDGEHPRYGRYTGQVEFDPLGDGRYTYRRVLSYGARDEGEVTSQRGYVLLRETPSDDVRGLVALGAGDSAFMSLPNRMGAYRLQGGDTLQGRSWDNGRGTRTTETFRRVGPDAPNNRIDLLIDGPEAFPSIYEAVENAQSSICLQTFSWFDDDTGARFARKLTDKVQDGVEVKVLIEAFPQMWGWKMGKTLEAGGVEVIIHHKLGRGLLNSIKRGFKRLFGMSRPKEKRGVLNHDHRKLIVVDGRIGFTGGMNIGDKYEIGTTWHDVHCRVEGSVVPKLEASFYERWHAAGGQGDALPAVAGDPWPGNLPVILDENLPGVRLDITDRYLEEIHGAREEILIENPYFLYDPVVHALKGKAQQGVRTVVIIPSNDLNDEALARDAFFWIQNDVIRSGVELYKYRDRMTHGKVAVFDRARTTLGTANLDHMAMIRNAELNLFVPDRGFADTTFERVFRVDIPASDRIQVEKLSWWNRVKGFLMNLIRRFL